MKKRRKEGRKSRREGGKEGGREVVLEAGDSGGREEAKTEGTFVIHGAHNLNRGAMSLGGDDDISVRRGRETEGARGGGRGGGREVGRVRGRKEEDVSERGGGEGLEKESFKERKLDESIQPQ